MTYRLIYTCYDCAPPAPPPPPHNTHTHTHHNLLRGTIRDFTTSPQAFSVHTCVWEQQRPLTANYAPCRRHAFHWHTHAYTLARLLATHALRPSEMTVPVTHDRKHLFMSFYLKKNYAGWCPRGYFRAKLYFAVFVLTLMITTRDRTILISWNTCEPNWTEERFLSGFRVWGGVKSRVHPVHTPF